MSYDRGTQAQRQASTKAIGQGLTGHEGQRQGQKTEIATMGRSAKEYCRPDQVIDGGGLVKSSIPDGVQWAKSRAGKKKAEDPAAKHKKTPTYDPESYKDKEGWALAGQAISDIIVHAKKGKKGKKK